MDITGKAEDGLPDIGRRLTITLCRLTGVIVTGTETVAGVAAVTGMATVAGIATAFATMIVTGIGTTNVKSITKVGAAMGKDSGANGVDTVPGSGRNPLSGRVLDDQAAGISDG